MFKKILMVTMSMDIGGAETHILELSTALKKKGFKVYIASNGGAYLPKILENGIEHIKVPLDNKKVSNIIYSERVIEKLILDEEIDIVHAHARIPMFVCGRVRKKIGDKRKFAYVTTDHARFKNNFLWRELTDWGDKTLAVSGDIKERLLSSYGLKSKDVILTVNGINENTFNKNVTPSDKDIMRKCEDFYNVLHVSRLSSEASIPIYALISNVEKIIEVKSKLRLIILGDGEEYENIKKLADEKNRKLGEKVVLVLGSKTNVNEYIALADVMVAISRSALEGMFSEKPVFVAGPYGVLGKLDESNVENALSDNFTCRNSEKFNEKSFIDKLVEYIEDEHKEKSVEYAKKIVSGRYSVDKMTQDALDVYDMSYNKIEAVIFGYIGFDNSGDDAIFDILSNSILKKYPGMNLSAISSSSDKAIMNENIKKIYSFNFFKIVKNIKNADIVIANGGSLLQDVTSSRSLRYYLWIINTAKKYGKHVCMIANGLGPINHANNCKKVRLALNKVDLITYRDIKSKILSDELEINKPDVRVTADLMFKYTNNGDVDSGIFRRLKLPVSGNIGVSIRPWKNIDIFSLQMARVCDKIIRELGVNIVFIPFQKTKRVDDIDAINRVIEKMEEKSYAVDEILNYREITYIISKMDVMISMRLHSAIYALVNRVPVYGLSYQPKVKVYLEKFNLPYTEDLEKLDADEIVKEIKKIIVSKDKISNKIGEQLIELSDKADENISSLCEYIDSNIIR